MLLDHYTSISKKYADKEAVLTTGGHATYSELDDMSEALRPHLRNFSGRDVVLFSGLSPQYFAALIACMKTGAVAVPVDPSLPDQHIKHQLAGISAACLLCPEDHYLRAKTLAGNHIVTVVLGETIVKGLDDGMTDGKPDPDGLLHRVFTSGSSGNQSLVAFSHATMLHDAIHTSAFYGFNNDTIAANLGRYTSSLGINGFWRIVLSGGTLVVFDLKTLSMKSVWQHILDYKVDTLQGQPTTLWKFIQSQHKKMKNPALRHIIIGGEPLKSTQLSDLFTALPGITKITYNYSSTETMLIAAYSASPEAFLAMEKIPVGMPGKDKHIIIVDEDGTQVAEGDFGQIVVASRYLASEIHGRNAHDKFFEDKENPGMKRYYTGDLGRINTQGLLEHYGRIDRQIKIHGLRIDPVITENELEKYPGIERAVVVSIDLSEYQTRLAAGIKSQNDISELSLIRHLSGVLPPSHIPQIFVNLDNIPQGPHGKTDLIAAKRMILEAFNKRRSVVHDGSTTSSYLKQLLIREWSALLGETVADTADSVFNLGADSMSVFDLTVRINTKLSLNLEPVWILSNPSIDLQEAYLQIMMKPANDEDVTYTPGQLKLMLGL